MSNAPAIFVPTPTEAAPAPALDRVTYDSPLPRPQNDHQMAEVVAAAQFLSDADSRLPETAETAREIFDLLGPENPFRTSVERGEGHWDPNDEDTGRDPRTGRFTQTVPHSAMHAERLRRKEAEAKARELETKVARAEERLGVLSELVKAAQTGQPQPQPGPHYHQIQGAVDPDIDVFSAVKQIQAETAKLKAERQEEKFLGTVKADIAQFVQQTPDFFDGLRHLVQSRDRELITMGMADQKQRVRQIASEERHLMQQALASGESPAKILYELAQQRGWRGKGKPALPAAPRPAYDPRAVEEIERMQQSRQASASLSGSGGSPGGGLSVAAIVDMPDHEFERLVEKLGGLRDPRIKAVFGG